MNTNLNTVLKNYYEAVAMHKKPKTESKLDHPILVLETKKGVKQLKLITDRKELSWFSRFLAFLGVGNASLVNVKNYLNQHKSEISKNNITVLGVINSKIALRNLSSRIQNITSIKLVKPL